jgi:DNA-binding MarR family transcriptional regulator
MEGRMDSDVELLETRLAAVIRLLAPHGVTPASGRPALSPAESALLLELHAAGESTQQQLADRLAVDKSRASRLSTVLETKGMLTRHRDEQNRRTLRVRITPAGRRTATRIRQAGRRRHERLLTAMTPRERRGLLVGLGALARELTTDTGPRA